MSRIASSVLLVGLLLGSVACRSPVTDRPATAFLLPVEGQVNAPGVYRFTQRTTIQSAIRRAGGVCEYPGAFRPNVAMVTSPDGRKQAVTFKRWGAFVLCEGYQVTVEQSFF